MAALVAKTPKDKKRFSDFGPSLPHTNIFPITRDTRETKIQTSKNVSGLHPDANATNQFNTRRCAYAG